MAEEKKLEGNVGDPPVKKEEVVKAPEYTDIELKALDMGWRPQEEWDGDAELFVDAKEYVGRKPLFDKIQDQGKALKETNKALEALKTHYGKVQEAAVKKAIAELEAQRAGAVADGDGDTFKRVDKQIKDAEAEAAEIKRINAIPLIQEQPAEHPAFVHWKNKNPWYTNDSAMRSYATTVGVELANKGMNPEDVLKEVEKVVRKEFPHKFTNPNKAGAPSVDTSRGNGKSTKSDGEADLTEQEKQIMNTLVRGGHITKEKYLADLKAVKERK